MKKILLVMIVLFSATAYADTSNVEIYGMMDVGVLSASGVGPQRGRTLQILSSPHYASRLGFRGMEKLSDDLSGGFALEEGFNPNDGSQGLGSGGQGGAALFSRSAAAILKSKTLGGITVGRQNNPMWDTFRVGDFNNSRNIGSSAVFFSDGSSLGGTATSKTGLTSFNGGPIVSNAIRYDTPIINNVTGSATFITGGQINNETAGSKTVFTGTYNKGPLVASLGYLNGKSNTGATTARSYVAGANYTFYDNTKVALGYSRFENPAVSAAAQSKFDVFQVSGSYDIIPHVIANAGYYILKDKVVSINESKLWSVGADYRFSKRTLVYLTLAHITNSGANGFAAYGGGGANINSLAGTGTYPSLVTVAGQSQTASVLGIRHTF